MLHGKGNLTTQHKWIVGLLIGLPLLLVLLKYCPVPGAEFLKEHVTLTDLPATLHRRLTYILFVPMGAVLVVLCRLTLGIRVLGPFRSILLAVAFQFTGIVNGLVFFSIVLLTIIGLRPGLKAMKLPYFGRVSVLLSMMSVFLVGALLLSEWFHSVTLLQMAHFPIFVLCLAGDGCAKTLAKEGVRSACWRAAMTAIVGIALTLLAQTPWIRQLLLMNPELLLFQIGCVIVISEYFDFRLLAWMNPAVVEDEDGEGIDAREAKPKPVLVDQKVATAA